MSNNNFTGITNFNGDVDMKTNNIVNLSNINGITSVGGLYVGITDAPILTATTTETSIVTATGVGSLTIDANEFVQGDSYQLVMAGHWESKNGDTITIRVKSSTTVLASAVITMAGATGQSFEIEANMVIREIGAPTVAYIITNLELTYSDAGTIGLKGGREESSNLTTFDTTISNTLDITAQYSTNSASNSIHCHMMNLTKIY